MTWEYVAGFFDGEGTITTKGRCFRVAITQTHEGVLNKIRYFSKVGYVCKLTKRKAHWKDSWIYYISTQKDIAFFLSCVVDYLVVKRYAAQNTLRDLSAYLLLMNKRREELKERRRKAKAFRKKGLSYRQIGKELSMDWGHARRIILGLE